MPRRRSYHRKRRTPWGWLAWLAAIVALLAIYFNGGLPLRPTREKTPTADVNLVDPNQSLVVAGTAGWEYRRTLAADLDGDGDNETIEVLAKAALTPGRSDDYQWDDGQPWQVYIRDGGSVTHVYARWVQLGRLDVFITDEERPRLGIAEAQGAGYALYVVAYNGPNDAPTQQLASLPVIERSWTP